MDHQIRQITQRRALDLKSRGFTKQDFKKPRGIHTLHDQEDSREPRCVRTPNGQIWAHDLNDLYDVRPSEDWPVPVYWSISMVREFESASNNLLDSSKTTEQKAHRDSWKVNAKKPWPLLKFPEEQRQGSFECTDIEKIPYSTETIAGTKLPPKLEEFIPNDFLPDILLVNDDDDCATGKQGLRGKTQSFKDRISEGESQRRYHRVLPTASHTDAGHPPKDEVRTAYLDLSRNNLCGTGNRSSVYQASFLPPPPLITNFRSLKGYVTVIAKTAFPSKKHRAHLDNEAEVLNKLSMKARRHIQQEWCGFNLLAGLTKPVPIGPVVPEFYGYYKPQPQSESTDHLSPILLVEDCGVPVKEGRLSQTDKEEIYSLFLRLHQARFVQNSPFMHNILIQPGPLTRPPIERSLTTPSFRTIDFGRALHRTKPVGVPNDRWKAVWEKRFAAECATNLDEVKEEIGFVDW
ncbi:hypothetical protein MMC15_006147 [Xylographa vitiligo]|nr:hypothetical protein [Xylographa vitiligo]